MSKVIVDLASMHTTLPFSSAAEALISSMSFLVLPVPFSPMISLTIRNHSFA